MKNQYNHLIIVLLLFLSTACQDNNTYVYQVQEETISSPTADKTKEKTIEQYVAVLYANLFQKPLAANELYDVSQVILSIGDKELAKEVIISNFLNSPEVLVPTKEEMRADVSKFIEETYERFLIRKPTALEKEHFTRYINARPNITPDMIYYSFAISNEYQYY